jgi:ankyrin repeat protein
MNRIEATRLLVSRGADILAVTGASASSAAVNGGGGRTALHLACSRGHGVVIRFLLCSSMAS